MDNFVVLCDTREQRNGHILESFSKNDIKFELKGLKFGDYSFKVNEKSYEEIFIIEKKQSLSEIAGNFTNGRDRFEREFIRAKEAGAKVILLIEDAKGREKIAWRKEQEKIGTAPTKNSTRKEKDSFFRNSWRSWFKANSMIGSLSKWKERYNFEIVFCDSKDTGKIIIDLFESYLNTK